MRAWRTILLGNAATWLLGMASMVYGQTVLNVKGTLLDVGPGFAVIDSGGPQRLLLSPTARIDVYAIITVDDIVAGAPCQLTGSMKVGESVAQAASLRFSANGQRRPDNTRINQSTNTWYLTDLNCVVAKKDPLTLKVLAGNKYFVSSQVGGAAFYAGPNLDGQTLTVDMSRLGPSTLRLDFGSELQMAGTKAEAQANISPQGGSQPVVTFLNVRRTEPLPRQAVAPPKKRKAK